MSKENAELPVTLMRGLRYLRTAAGYTQEDAARVIGVTQSHYGKMERGEQQLRSGQMLALAKWLEVSLDELL